MPLTSSHPAAVLPFKRVAGLNFAALVIGSMTPDAGYFLGLRHMAKIAHHPDGTVLICIPTGIVLLGLFYLLRRDLCFILPSPHRNKLTPLASRKTALTAKAFLMAALSVLIGAWTHIVWDQFTHDGTFLARHFAPWRTVLFQVGSSEVTVAYSLQYISTIAGAAILAFAYMKWLRTQLNQSDNESDGWRYLMWFGLGAVALAIGYAVAKHVADPVHNLKTLREFVYAMGVASVSSFTVLIVTAAVLCYSHRSN
jgi:hypothetical protein